MAIKRRKKLVKKKAEEPETTTPEEEVEEAVEEEPEAPSEEKPSKKPARKTSAKKKSKIKSKAAAKKERPKKEPKEKPAPGENPHRKDTKKWHLFEILTSTKEGFTRDELHEKMEEHGGITSGMLSTCLYASGKVEGFELQSLDPKKEGDKRRYRLEKTV